MIVVDSGSIISLAINCLCPLLTQLDKQFVISPSVHKEIVEKPSSNKRFQLEALRMQMLLANGTVKVVNTKTDYNERFLDAANRVYRIKGKDLKIIHQAEAEVVGLAYELGAEAMLVDERTLRMLIEDPVSLRDLLSHRNKANVKLNEHNLVEFQRLSPKIPIIRSSEIVAVSYEMGLLSKMHQVSDKKVLEAALSALKFSGCSITWEEIDKYSKDVI